MNASEKIMVPGFIDGHQHFTGGGGEGGFHTRTPEMQLSMNIANGVTTAVGLLGTDALTRTVESLYAKTQAFNAEGITAYMLTGHTGCLHQPSVAAWAGYRVYRSCDRRQAGHGRSARPSFDSADLATLASDVRVSALISNKPGIITVHTGVNPDGLDLIFEVVKTTQSGRTYLSRPISTEKNPRPGTRPLNWHKPEPWWMPPAYPGSPMMLPAISLRQTLPAWPMTTISLIRFASVRMRVVPCQNGMPTAAAS